MLRVHLTFDVEVWCPGWGHLDETFPTAFERYVWGRSAAGNYGLPRNLDILRQHGLRAVFFVEPLFSLRFGQRYLQTIVDLIMDAGQEVQLHLHPEWVDEIQPPLIPNTASKRQHLTDYDLPEQVALLSQAKAALEVAAGRPVSAFRSGGYAVNRQTYAALSVAGISVDSSLNATFDRTAGSLGANHSLLQRRVIDGIDVHPVTAFRDGRGRLRHLQVGACGFQEMRQVLDCAWVAGLSDVVLVSHNFELLKPGGAQPDRIVERRFDALCGHLARHTDRFQVVGFDGLAPAAAAPAGARPGLLAAGMLATGLRLGAQALRRVL